MLNEGLLLERPYRWPRSDMETDNYKLEKLRLLFKKKQQRFDLSG